MNGPYTRAVMFAAETDFKINPEDAAKSVRGLIILAIGVLLAWITFQSIRKHGSRGDYSGAANVGAATVVSLIPMAIGATLAILLGYGEAMLNLATSILS